MASGNNVRNAKEIIEYYNRKFTITTTGVIGSATGEFRFKLPPMNETQFSNNYSQCLCRIKEVQISNQATGTYADEMNPVFVGIGATAGLKNVDNGIVLTTSFPCRNIKHTASNFEDSVWGAENYFDNSFHTIFHPEIKYMYIENATPADGRTTRGSPLVLFTPDVKNAGNPQFQISESKHCYLYKDDSSFDDGATLIGNPFGQQHICRLRSAYNGELLQLASGIDPTNARNGTAVRIKFEFLMLENPTPNDR